MNSTVLAVTGDLHGAEERLMGKTELCNRYLAEGDYLFIAGDFGMVCDASYRERLFLKCLAEDIPYTVCFCDGNHENFDLLNAYEVTKWHGGKVHIIRKNQNGVPKVIHLMRGQIYQIEDKKIFVFGGGYSIDKVYRIPGRSWWKQEMPNEEEMAEAISNLQNMNWKVDYIITHAAPESIMSMLCPKHENEKPLNDFLEYIREKCKYTYWFMGHLHKDYCVSAKDIILWKSLRNMENGIAFE